MFKSCAGFEIQAFCMGIKKKNIRRNSAKQEKKTRKIQEHYVQNSPFQGFYKHKKNIRTVQGNQGIQVRVTTSFTVPLNTMNLSTSVIYNISVKNID